MIQEALPTLPPMPEGEAIGQNYGSTGLSLRKHPLALVEGRVERENEHSGVPIVHLIASRLADRSDLLGRLAELGEIGTARPEAVPVPRMPATRDFR